MAAGAGPATPSATSVPSAFFFVRLSRSRLSSVFFRVLSNSEASATYLAAARCHGRTCTCRVPRGAPHTCEEGPATLAVVPSAHTADARRASFGPPPARVRLLASAGRGRSRRLPGARPLRAHTPAPPWAAVGQAGGGGRDKDLRLRGGGRRSRARPRPTTRWRRAFVWTEVSRHPVCAASIAPRARYGTDLSVRHAVQGRDGPHGRDGLAAPCGQHVHRSGEQARLPVEQAGDRHVERIAVNADAGR